MGQHRKNGRHVYETRFPVVDADWDDIAQIEKVKDCLYYKGITVPTTTAIIRNAVRYYCGMMINKHEQQQPAPEEQPPQEEDTYNE